ncbi:MAG: hypothetical protein IPL23_04300 [Saprospiraceae bacterium]|jgi:hypothetical protein|nr:hypothetical protein [Saprospiraceae bacterium]MBP7641823.1 hypothetical protein [Saprospiraceae bacterium]
MKTISLKIEDSIFIETEQILANVQMSRNRYINLAIEHYNKLQKRKLLAQKLKDESDLVKVDSMNVLEEFERIENTVLIQNTNKY